MYGYGECVRQLEQLAGEEAGRQSAERRSHQLAAELQTERDRRSQLDQQLGQTSAALDQQTQRAQQLSADLQRQVRALTTRRCRWPPL